MTDAQRPNAGYQKLIATPLGQEPHPSLAMDGGSKRLMGEAALNRCFRANLVLAARDQSHRARTVWRSLQQQHPDRFPTGLLFALASRMG